MPRPSTPLISRESAVAASLKIIASEGLESFSLPRLAQALGVRAPSLYHHFADKAELLTEVAKHVVASTPIPEYDETEHVFEWLVELCCNARSTILRHRKAADVVLRYLPHEFLLDIQEQIAEYLEADGVPADRQALVVDGLERITFGGTAAEAQRPAAPRNRVIPGVAARREPHLKAALSANPYGQAELFEESVRCFLASAIEPAA